MVCQEQYTPRGRLQGDTIRFCGSVRAEGKEEDKEECNFDCSLLPARTMPVNHQRLLRLWRSAAHFGDGTGVAYHPLRLEKQ